MNFNDEELNEILTEKAPLDHAKLVTDGISEIWKGMEPKAQGVIEALSLLAWKVAARKSLGADVIDEQEMEDGLRVLLIRIHQWKNEG